MFIEATIPHDDPRAGQAYRSCLQHGRHLGDVPHGHGSYYIQDGKVWLFCRGTAVRLGNYSDWRYEVSQGIRKVEGWKRCTACNKVAQIAKTRKLCAYCESDPFIER